MTVEKVLPLVFAIWVNAARRFDTYTHTHTHQKNIAIKKIIMRLIIELAHTRVAVLYV